MPILVGVGLVDVGDLEQSVSVHRKRYLQRMYDDHERGECGSDARRLSLRLAERAAAAVALAEL